MNDKINFNHWTRNMFEFHFEWVKPNLENMKLDKRTEALLAEEYKPKAKKGIQN